METLVTTYAVAVLAVCAYVVWLGLGTRRLARRWRKLQTSFQSPSGNSISRVVA